MLEKAIKILKSSLDDLDIESETGDRIVEAITLLENYMDADKVIAFTIEHYTTEQIVKRCKTAIVEAFGDDYRECIIRLESKK